eukprot:4250960-Pyramimonas_sp.AAC.1
MYFVGDRRQQSVAVTLSAGVGKWFWRDISIDGILRSTPLLLAAIPRGHGFVCLPGCLLRQLGNAITHELENTVIRYSKLD